MQWWNDFVDWTRTDDGWAVLTGAIFPFLAILAAGVVGAIVGRGSTRRIVNQRDHEARASAVAALVTVGKAASTWHSLPPAEKEHSELLASAADIHVRLLPIAGAALAADWAEHQLDDMRANSVNYTFQPDQTLDEYRDRLVRWLHKPAKAKKLFGDDLDRWRYDNSQPDPLGAEQNRWADEQFTANQAAVPASVLASVVPSSAPATSPTARVHVRESDPLDALLGPASTPSKR